MSEAPVREEGRAFKLGESDLFEVADIIRTARGVKHVGSKDYAVADEIVCFINNHPRNSAAALATRHEAPAEAGEPARWTDDETCAAAEKYGAIIERNHLPEYHDVISFTPSELREFLSSLRAQPPAREARDCGNGHQPGCDCDVPEEDVARSKPPAREDAQPVASAYRVRPEMNDPEEWTLMHPERAFDYLDRPGWETQPLYTHPASDALRVAVEGIDADYMTSETHHPGYVLIPIIKFDAIRAALQAEQKGGAA